MNPHSDKKIIDSWKKNASQWTTVVRDGRIESRKLATDEAIVNAILSRSPCSVLDIGCGEGWLVRELAAKTMHVVGVDVVPSLIECARTSGGGDFHVTSYEAIADGAIEGTFDVVVCNFSLLGKESVEGIFKAAPSLLSPRGALIVQTLHPVMACGDLPYRDGWREGSWDGFSRDFMDPPPWYFRTLGSWLALLSNSGLRLTALHEPIHPGAGKPLSVIFVAEAMADHSSQQAR